tara:strand:+ start:172 stop:441 length:270 start_codon:yes stop_codon:yes gene_type:complete
MNDDEIQKRYEDFVVFCRGKGFTTKIDTLTFFNHKNGNAMKLLREKQVAVINKNSIVDAEFECIDGKIKEIDENSDTCEPTQDSQQSQK